MKWFGRRTGQSLMELLIGMAVGAVFLVGVATIVAPSLKAGKQAGIVETQAQLASELQTNIESWAAGNWNQVLDLATTSANTYYLDTATSPFSVVAASGTSGGGPTYKTISYVQSTSTASAAATTETLTFPNPVASGDLLAVGTFNSGGSGITISDTLGNSFSKIALSTSPDHESQVWIATTTASGADTVTITATGNVWGGSIFEYKNTANGNIASIIDASSSDYNNSNALDAGTLTTTQTGDLVLAYFVTGDDNANTTFTYNPSYTFRELASGITQFCSAVYQPANCIGAEDIQASSTGSYTPTSTISQGSDAWTGVALAIKPALNSGSGSSQFSGTSTQAIFIGGYTYYRYFYVDDVYRDASGNVTTTASGNNYDPSTKLVTVLVNASSTGVAISHMSFYLTRNQSNAFIQTSWSGGSGQSTPLNVVSTTYADESNITISATGTIQLTNGGGSCIY